MRFVKSIFFFFLALANTTLPYFSLSSDKTDFDENDVKTELEAFKKDPLGYAASNIYQEDFIKVLKKLKNDSPDKFKKLCFEKPEQNNPHGDTLLTMIGKKFLFIVIQYLAENRPDGASLDLQNDEGNTALHYFCAIPQVSRIGNPDVFTKPYFFEKNEAIVGPLEKDNIKTYYNNENARFEEELKDAQSGSYITAFEGDMSFWNTISDGALSLIEADASFDIPNNKKQTALHLCTYYANGRIFRFMSGLNGDRILASKKRLTKTALTKQDADGNTPLHLYLNRAPLTAGKRGACHPDIEIPFFIDNGADLAIKNKNDETPLDIIKKVDSSKVTDYYKLLCQKAKQPTQPAFFSFATLKNYWKPIAVLCGAGLLAFLTYRFYLKPKFAPTSLLTYFKKQPNKSHLLLSKTFSLQA